MRNDEVRVGQLLKQVRFWVEARDGPTIQVTEVQEDLRNDGTLAPVIGTVLDSGSSPFPVGKLYLAPAKFFETVDN